MRILVIFVSLISLHVMGNTSPEGEFTNFYDNEIIDFNKCGLNTKHFLTQLKRKGISLKGTNGFVVSVHEDMGLLNHFKGRWGRRDSYENGITYNRSNWYFHVFAVIGGKAYDFSHQSDEAIDLFEYLTTSYLPKYKTSNIFMLGKVTRDDLLKKFLNIKMRIYPLYDYEKDLGPAIYNGTFADLFRHVGVSIPKSYPKNNTEKIPAFKKNAYGSLLMGKTTNYLHVRKAQIIGQEARIEGIALNVLNEKYPILAKDYQLCQAYGFSGSKPRETEITIVRGEGSRFTELSCTSYNVSDDFQDGLKCSFRYAERGSYGATKAIKKIECTNFDSYLRSAFK